MLMMSPRTNATCPVTKNLVRACLTVAEPRSRQETSGRMANKAAAYGNG